MPTWALILTVVFSFLSLVGSAVGGLVHARLSAKNSGRLEQMVDGLTEEMSRQRTAVGACQLAEQCEKQMDHVGDRLKSAHVRMDRQDGRLDKHDDLIRGLGESVAALKGSA
jgi:hypothetical protein